MKKMKKWTILCGLLLVCCSVVHSAVNLKPFVIPELQQWKGATGVFAFNGQTTIVVQDKSLLGIAETFASDIQTMFGKSISIKIGKPGVNDISFSVEQVGSDNKEAYSIDIRKDIKVKANDPIGVFWATRTLLQMMEASDGQTLPKGSALDYPDYPMRGFMLDCGRKFFTIDFLRDYVRFMSYYKMNTFQIHLNDNSFKQYFGNDWDKTQAAFRLESETYPGLAAADGHYTKQEFIDLQILAENLGVLIIPEIDVPAHTLALTRYMPEIGSVEYGMDHLDLFNPKTYEFVDGLFKEYISGENPVFRGPIVHIGTDEYSNAKKEVVEQFRAFTDHYIRYVESFGKKAALWGALTHAAGETPVKVDNVLMSCWYNGYAQPRDMKALGYEMLSIPDGLLYIVPEAGYYYNYLNTKRLYEEWTPVVIGKEVFEERDPQIKGGMFAVWNDHSGNGISSKDVHHRVWPAMQTLAAKMWTGKQVSIPFDQFDTLRETLSEAPGVNILGRVKGQKGEVFSCDTLRAGDKNELTEIGYDYRLEFTLRAAGNINGSSLFHSPDATVYLRTPDTGKLGFSRDGYLNSFNYEVPNDQDVRIAIEGDNLNTRLYVDDKLQDELTKKIIYFDQEKKIKRAYIQTLVFPLAEVGNFKGTISNLKVIVK